MVKSLRIGQSAAKILSNKYKVQRLKHGILPGYAEDGKVSRMRNTTVSSEDIV